MKDEQAPGFVPGALRNASRRSASPEVGPACEGQGGNGANREDDSTHDTHGDPSLISATFPLRGRGGNIG
jgi:hypothetical protein